MHRRFRSYIPTTHNIAKTATRTVVEPRGEDDAVRRRREHARIQTRDNCWRGGVHREGVRQKTRYRAISGGVRG